MMFYAEEQPSYAISVKNIVSIQKMSGLEEIYIMSNTSNVYNTRKVAELDLKFEQTVTPGN